MAEEQFQATHYVRVEGVNLAHFVLDTADLSTIRGGGLTLLRGISRPRASAGSAEPGPADNVSDWLAERLTDANVRPVSTGASSGLFALRLKGDGVPGQVEENLRRFLRTQDLLGQATWVCDLLPATGDFAHDRECLLAANRFAQMRAPSLVAPSWNVASDPKAVPPCHFDGLRPGTEKVKLPPSPGETEPVVQPASLSTKLRRQYGQTQRRWFYREEAGNLAAAEVGADEPERAGEAKPAPDGFTQHLEELAGGPFPPGLPGQLREKIAVLYFDGNKFGNLQATLCRTEPAQRIFDDTVKKLRRQLLRKLLLKMEAGGTTRETNPAWFSTENNRRLETLLWGGDEIIWVVPAWQGWAVLDFFFQGSADWQVTVPDVDGVERTKRLTHAAGLVFAHHNAPIHRLTALARNLANGVKAQIKKANPPIDPYTPAANRADYEILESFDHVGPCLDSYRRARVPAWMADTPGDLHLDGARVGELAEVLRDLKAHDFPTRQIHRNYEVWRGTTERPNAAAFEKDVRSNPNLAQHADRLIGAAGMTGLAGFWHHLAQLWDYVARVPVPPETALNPSSR